VEEISMKKPKTVADLLIVTNVCIKASEVTEVITRTEETTDIAASNPQSRRKKAFSASRQRREVV
jgi:hypothetical protein